MSSIPSRLNDSGKPSLSSSAVTATPEDVKETLQLMKAKIDQLESELQRVKLLSEQDTLARQADTTEKVNVGGTVFTTTLQALTSFPSSLLGKIYTGQLKVHLDEKGYPFIDRSPKYFEYILQVLRGEELELPEVPKKRRLLARELEYYHLPLPVSLLHEMFERADMDVDVEIIRTLTGHRSTVICIDLIPPLSLVSGSTDTTLKVWDLPSGNCVATLEGHTEAVECVHVVSFNEQKVMMASGSRDRTARIWQREKGVWKSHVILRGHEGVVMTIAIASGGNMAVTGSEDRTIKVWDLKEGECTKTIHCEDWVFSVQLVGGLLISGRAGKEDCVQVWDLSSGEVIQTLKTSSSALSLYVSEDKIHAGLRNGSVVTWDLITGTLESTLYGHNGLVWCVQSLGNLIVTGSVDKSIRLWSARDKKCIRTLLGHKGTVNCVKILGNLIISGSVDKSIKIWSAVGAKAR